jgi:hypothetical protein
LAKNHAPITPQKSSSKNYVCDVLVIEVELDQGVGDEDAGGVEDFEELHGEDGARAAEERFPQVAYHVVG